MSEYRRVEHYLYDDYVIARDMHECMIAGVRPLFYRQPYVDIFAGKKKKLAGLLVTFTPGAKGYLEHLLHPERKAEDIYDPVTFQYYDLRFDLFNVNSYFTDRDFKLLHELANSIHARGLYNLDSNDQKDLVNGYMMRLLNSRYNLFDLSVKSHTRKDDKDRTYNTYSISPSSSSTDDVYYESDFFKRHPDFGLKYTRLGNEIIDTVEYTDEDKEYLKQFDLLERNV